MSREIIISLILLLGGLMVSCQDDILLPEEESTILITDIDALRSMKPTSTSGRSGSAIHDGEKGRDRRDNVDYDSNEGLKIETPTELQVGDLYVAGYDKEKNEYLLKFYWGDEISEETKAMLTMAHVNVGFIRQGYGGPHWAKNTSFNQTGSFGYYTIGDTYSLPGEFCLSCTCIEIEIHYTTDIYCNYSYYKEWTQSFETLNLKGATK